MPNTNSPVPPLVSFRVDFSPRRTLNVGYLAVVAAIVSCGIFGIALIDMSYAQALGSQPQLLVHSLGFAAGLSILPGMFRITLIPPSHPTPRNVAGHP